MSDFLFSNNYLVPILAIPTEDLFNTNRHENITISIADYKSKLNASNTWNQTFLVENF